MSERSSRKTADLEMVNNELRQSLVRCRELLADTRSKLAANEDDQPFAAPDRKTGKE
jgi:hypothetical protein